MVGWNGVLGVNAQEAVVAALDIGKDIARIHVQ